MFARDEKGPKNAGVATSDNVAGADRPAVGDSATRSAIQSANRAIDAIKRRDFPAERLLRVSSLDELVNINADVRAEVTGDAIDGWFKAHGLRVSLEASTGISHYYTVRDRETGVKSTFRVSNHKTLTHKGTKPVPDTNIVDSTFGEAVNQIADALDRAAVEAGKSFRSPRFTSDSTASAGPGAQGPFGRRK
ncbi:MAG: hypothetical protein ACRETC_09140 [Gammaproteobacteria bacterium]